jgi:hypothetical protein
VVDAPTSISLRCLVEIRGCPSNVSAFGVDTPTPCNKSEMSPVLDAVSLVLVHIFLQFSKSMILDLLNLFTAYLQRCKCFSVHTITSKVDNKFGLHGICIF